MIGGLALFILFIVMQTDSLAQVRTSWDNWKLANIEKTAVLSDQTRELSDLVEKNIEPEKHARIDLSDLRNGGPSKDGIPSIDNPVFDTAETTPFDTDEIVIGIELHGEQKAYPYGILNWHEIVNDQIGSTNITISLCPLCDTISAIERGDTTFGVSGKIYQSCLVMYDRSDDTLYSQPWLLGIVGPAVDNSLKKIPVTKTTLGSWLAKYPKSKILSTKTGYDRDYFRYPYGSYYTDDRLIFPVRHQDQLTEQAKEIVSYIWRAASDNPKNTFSGASLQFVHRDIKSAGSITAQFDGQQIVARWDPDLATVIVADAAGTIIPSSTAFSFVYPAFFGDG